MLNRNFVIGGVAAMVWCAGAMAQVDEAAKKAISESYDAMQKVQRLSMHVSTPKLGLGPEAKSEIDIKLVRGKEIPIAVQYTGKLILMKGEQKVAILIEHMDKPATRRRVTWTDEAAKKVFTQLTGPGSRADELVGNTERGLLGPYDLEKNMFEGDLRGQKIEFAGAEERDGVACQVIKIKLEKDNERTLIIGAADHLPRFYERRRGSIAQSWTFSKVSDSETAFKDEDMKIKTPEGYTAENLPDPKPVVPNNVVNPPGTPANPLPADKNKEAAPAGAPTGKPNGLRLTPGGLTPGSPVPAWELAGLNGTKVKSDELKGKTVVLGFWSPRLGGANASADMLNEVAKSAGESCKVFGVACRLEGEDDEKAVKDLWASKSYAFSGLLNGDELLGKLNVRGMPSFVVIGPDGNAKAFFEGSASPLELSAAIGAK